MAHMRQHAEVTNHVQSPAFGLQFLHEHILVCFHTGQAFTMLDCHFSLGHCFLDAFSFKLLPEFAVLDLKWTD
jgi:hypothetical protein